MSVCSTTSSGVASLRLPASSIVSGVFYQQIFYVYDYEAALSTKYTKLDEVMKDITICPSLSFNELVTKVCPTNDIDLNAYRKHQNGEGPKFQSIMAHHQEQLLVESAENALKFFCARLRRFSQDPKTGVRKKDNTPIQPSRKVEFHIKDNDNTVAYDLCAVTVHSGQTGWWPLLLLPTS